MLQCYTRQSRPVAEGSRGTRLFLISHYNARARMRGLPRAEISSPFVAVSSPLIVVSSPHVVVSSPLMRISSPLMDVCGGVRGQPAPDTLLTCRPLPAGANRVAVSCARMRNNSQ